MDQDDLNRIKKALKEFGLPGLDVYDIQLLIKTVEYYKIQEKAQEAYNYDEGHRKFFRD